MNTRNTKYILLGLTVVVFVVGLVLYPSFPEQVASHWNANGEVDGYMSKFSGIFLFGFIMAGMLLVYFFIPRFDPLKKNIDSFRPAYNSFWIWMFVFFAYIFGLSMLWNIGYRFNFTKAIVPAMSVLFYVIGAVLEKSKRNYFMGIRTPWTLSSDVVWDKTHKLGGKLFKIAGLVSLLGMFTHGLYTILVIIIPVVLVSVATMIYSYFEYKKIESTLD